MMQGMAMGVGSSIGRRMVDGVMGPSGGSSNQSESHQQVQAPAPTVPQACQIDHSAYLKCMQDNNNSSMSCDYYLNAFNQCQSNHA